MVWVVPDLTAAYDYLGLDYVTPDIEALGATRLKNPGKIALFIDHHTPPRSAAEAETHVRTRLWSKKHGVRLYEGLGIGHQVMIELGLARPGMFVAQP